MIYTGLVIYVVPTHSFPEYGRKNGPHIGTSLWSVLRLGICKDNLIQEYSQGAVYRSYMDFGWVGGWLGGKKEL